MVRKLFLIQLFLGVATAFLFTSALTQFLHEFDVKYIPAVYLLSALLLLIANVFYSRLEQKYSSKKLLEKIIILSAVSLVVTWFAFSFIPIKGMPLLLVAWNLVIYMLIGYGFWGMAAIIFNVRESKRIFSLVGSGDLPAKLLGYALVPLLIPYVGVNNLLWVSVCAFALAYYVLHRFHHQEAEKEVHHHLDEHQKRSISSPLMRIFHSRLIFYIALFSLTGYIVYALIDYTLLGEIKSRFSSSPQLAVFISLFFAIGRVLAIIFKVLFSSRLISKLGLSNSLLISPFVLILVTSLMFVLGADDSRILYIFGIMVLLSEVLKSTVQEPAFFILFQPLDPHIRLKGHLIAKGYMLPFALLASGVFLWLGSRIWGGISVLFMGQVLVGLLFIWILSVYLVRNAYKKTLVHSIKKGWFTGTALFLNDASVKSLLLQKVYSNNPKEIVVALELLERSGDKQLIDLLLEVFQRDFEEVKKYALQRLVKLEAKEVLPFVEIHLKTETSKYLRTELVKAFYFFAPVTAAKEHWHLLPTKEDKKYALIGLLMRNSPEACEMAVEYLDQMVHESSSHEDKCLALDVMYNVPLRIFKDQLETLLSNASDVVVKQAIEVTGKTRCYRLLNNIIKSAADHKAYYSLQKALVLFGNKVFSEEALQPHAIDSNLTKAVIAAAGKAKGEQPARYLVDILSKYKQYSDEAVVALWQMQQELPSDAEELVKQWVREKVSNCRQLASACRLLRQNHDMQLLSDTLERELADDVNTLMRGLALCYGRQHIDRVSKLLQIGNSSKIANAIEILEHTVPKRLFKEIDAILDFVLDVKERREVWLPKSHEEVEALLERIITGDGINCTTWCRSVACFLLPHLPGNWSTRILANNDRLPEEAVFQETRDYVLSVLK
ncbi:MFS transporter [Pontibacter sp. MBLB2868]|uniref:MFS transporter n=1 Tax=Pontibacter sp. MBLB2868 TaxID=3451555 RepID=UPI003F74D001